MKAKLAITALAAIILLIACGKDKFTTVPQVKIKSIKPDVVTQGNLIQFRSDFTDQEGDVDTIFLVYKWYAGSAASRIDTILRAPISDYNLPANTRQGELFVEFVYGVIVDGYVQLSSVNKDTTAAFGLVLKDKAGNRSEYKESDPIRLIKP
jgi:hypothetical protein